MRKRLPFICTILILIPAALSAQTKITDPDEVKVFVDCNARCDMSYVKTEINYVDLIFVVLLMHF